MRNPRTRDQDKTQTKSPHQVDDFPDTVEELRKEEDVEQTDLRKEEDPKPPKLRTAGGRFSPEALEIINSLVDVGHADSWIAKHMGCDKTTIAKHRLKRERDPSLKDPNEEVIRAENRAQFIREAYELAFKLLEDANDPEKRKNASLKEIVTALGIVMDKVLVASGRFEETETSEWAGIKKMEEEELDQFIEKTSGAFQLLVGRQQRKSSKQFPETDAESS